LAIKIILIKVIIVCFSVAQTHDLIDFVLENNHEIKAAKTAYLTAQKKVKVAGALPEPFISNSFGIIPIETRNGPIENQIMLSQKIPFLGKLKQERNIALVEAEIEKIKFLQTKIQIVYMVRKHIADFRQFVESLKILEKYKNNLESFINNAQTRYANGLDKSQSTILKLELELVSVENKINDLRGQLESSKNELKAIIGDNDFEKFKISNISPPVDVDAEEFWFTHARENNPRYLKAIAKVTLAENKYKLTKANTYPDLIAGLTYTFIGSFNSNENMQIGTDALGFKIGINLPIWFVTNRAKVQLARLNQQQQSQLLLDVWNHVEATIQNNLSALREANRIYDNYKDNILKTAEQLSATSLSAIGVGMIDFIDLLETMRISVQTKLEFEKIKAKRSTLSAKLYQSVGMINKNKENKDVHKD